MRNQRPELSNAVLDSLTESVAMIDTCGTIVGVNETWRNFAASNHGESKQHYVGQNYLDICERAARQDGDAVAKAMYDGMRSVLEGGLRRFSLEYPCPSPSQPRWFIAHVTPSRESNPPHFFVVAHEDITARKLAEMKLEQAERSLRMILDALPIGVWLTDAEGRIVQSNPAGQQIWSTPDGVSLPRDGSRLSDGRPFAASDWAAAETLRSGDACADEALLLAMPDGRRRVLLHATVPLKDGDGRVTGAVIIDRDITIRHESDELLRQAQLDTDAANRALAEALARERVAARSDELTGIANRRHFFELGNQIFTIARRYGQPLSLVVFDLDHFKRINDHHGHQQGDRCLQHVAHLTLAELRGADLLARYGGEEFVILLPETGATEALAVAERVRWAIESKPLASDRGAITISISAGIACIDADDSDTLERLIGRADVALYAAKAAGRNRCLLQP